MSSIAPSSSVSRAPEVSSLDSMQKRAGDILAKFVGGVEYPRMGPGDSVSFRVAEDGQGFTLKRTALKPYDAAQVELEAVKGASGEITLTLRFQVADNPLKEVALDEEMFVNKHPNLFPQINPMRLDESEAERMSDHEFTAPIDDYDSKVRHLQEDSFHWLKVIEECMAHLDQWAEEKDKSLEGEFEMEAAETRRRLEAAFGIVMDRFTADISTSVTPQELRDADGKGEWLSATYAKRLNLFTTLLGQLAQSDFSEDQLRQLVAVVQPDADSPESQ